MLVFTSALVIGFALLMWSANSFTDNALGIAAKLNISKVVVGIVILGFGTSAPELLVSGLSAWQGNPGIAIGNAIGSNITNILLILGITLCIIPLIVNYRVLKRDFSFLIGATILFALLIIDKTLNFFDGIILVGALILILSALAHFEMKESANREITTSETIKSLPSLFISIVFGLVILLISSKLVVWAAASIAEAFGVSDLIIGLTVIAFGTSLPELATCVASALKKHGELAIGNVIGSNIFNTLGVTGAASLIANYSIPQQIYQRDFPVMLIATIILFLLAWVYVKKNSIPRSFGIIFATGYIAYIAYIYFQLT